MLEKSLLKSDYKNGVLGLCLGSCHPFLCSQVVPPLFATVALWGAAAVMTISSHTTSEIRWIFLEKCYSWACQWNPDG